jgi:hypothetical protein
MGFKSGGRLLLAWPRLAGLGLDHDQGGRGRDYGTFLMGGRGKIAAIAPGCRMRFKVIWDMLTTSLWTAIYLGRRRTERVESGESFVLSKADVDRFNREGYLIVPSVFSATEAQELLRRVRAGAVARTSTTLFAIEGLQDFWAEPRLLAISRALLGDNLCFNGEASVLREAFQPGEHISGRHLHHDAKGTPEHLLNRMHRPMPEGYSVLRFAIYLQDYTNQSGGIKVSPGSHLIDSSNFDESDLPYVNARTRPGDVVVFSARTLHSPYFLLLKDHPEIALSAAEEDAGYAADPDAFLPHPGKRDTLFLDYFRPDEMGDLNIKNRTLFLGHRKPGFARAVIRSQLAAKINSQGMIPRMDQAVIDATLVLSEELRAPEGVTDDARQLLLALPQLCRDSQEFSPYFSFVPKNIGADGPKGALAVFNELAPRINEVIAEIHSKPKTSDWHMSARQVGQATARMM